jgi:transposase
MKGLTLNTKEQARLQVLNGVLEGDYPVRQAVEILGMSERHGWRLLAAYRKEGAAALAHGNRGRVPANAIPAWLRQQVVALA